MSSETKITEPEISIPFLYALLPMFVMIGTMAIAIIQFEASPHVPLIIGAATAALVAMRFGYSWKSIEQGIYRGITMALPAIVIIIMIGLTIGAWLGGGIVATMIYYGLKLISPSLSYSLSVLFVPLSRYLLVVLGQLWELLEWLPWGSVTALAFLRQW
ncbi:hypothetical protein [Lonepinella koalarum]